MKHYHGTMRIADNPDNNLRCFQHAINPLDDARRYVTGLMREELKHWRDFGIDDHGLDAEDIAAITAEHESAICHVNVFDAIHKDRTDVKVNINTPRLDYEYEIMIVDMVCS